MTQEDILIYNSFMSKRGWRDDETDEFIPEMIKEHGLKESVSRPSQRKTVTDSNPRQVGKPRWPVKWAMRPSFGSEWLV